MKRILFVSPSLRPGGQERMLVTLSNRLADEGYRVKIIILQQNTALADELDPRIEVVYRPPHKPPLGKKIPYIRHKLYDDGMREKRISAKGFYRRYVKNEKYDVEIAFFRGRAVKIVSGSTNRAAVHLAWVHSDFRNAQGYMHNFRNVGEVFDAYAKFDKVICVSDQARQGFIETIGDTGNTQTIYNLLPVSRIRELSCEKIESPTDSAELKLVIVGRLSDRTKGQLRLIRSVFRLHEEGKSVSLTIVGSGDDEELLRKTVKEHDAESYIHLVGERRNPYPYIKNADLLVCASYYEGFNLTVAEALILGVPVLSTECTGPVEILDNGEYGMLVENSEEGLYKGIDKLYSDPALLDRYREKAKQRQDFFNEERIVKQITNLFEKEL